MLTPVISERNRAGNKTLPLTMIGATSTWTCRPSTMRVMALSSAASERPDSMVIIRKGIISRLQITVTNRICDYDASYKYKFISLCVRNPMQCSDLDGGQDLG